VSEILLIEEVSELLRTPSATLRYWRHIGKGPRSFKIGARVAYKRTDVEQWIEEQYNAGSR
jgi:predicted DNA-binding transcriptional regulator AlpA